MKYLFWFVCAVHASFSVLVLHSGTGLLCLPALQSLLWCEKKGECAQNISEIRPEEQCKGKVCKGCLFLTHIFLSPVWEQDFKEQVIHHTATLTLLSFSWISNYIRIGTIVMALHDCADILLEVSACFFQTLFCLFIHNWSNWWQTNEQLSVGNNWPDRPQML